MRHATTRSASSARQMPRPPLMPARQCSVDGRIARRVDASRLAAATVPVDGSRSGAALKLLPAPCLARTGAALRHIFDPGRVRVGAALRIR